MKFMKCKLFSYSLSGSVSFKKGKWGWNGEIAATLRNLPGGGPQGSRIGLLEYDSQSNDNNDVLFEDDKVKFVDNLSVLEIINLIANELSSYNFKQYMANDFGIEQLYLPAQKNNSQE